MPHPGSKNGIESNMVQQYVLDCAAVGGGLRGEEAEKTGRGQRVTAHSHSEPSKTRLQRLKDAEETSSGESRDTICEPSLPTFSNNIHLRILTTSSARQPCCADQESPTSSRPNSPLTSPSRPSLPSSSTSFTIDIHPEPQTTNTQGRPSILTRLKSSISTSSASPKLSRGNFRQLSDFQLPPEHPEKHFIDSVGMVIPGVINRSQCAHPLAHFVTNWRLCEPTEYTTALADHGITYTDYCRLVATLANFLDEIPNEPKRTRNRKTRWWNPKEWQTRPNKESKDLEMHYEAALQRVVTRKNSATESAEQFKKTEHHAANLTKLLADITWNWQARGIPVMVCIGSFSLFAPNRISESHVQILHVSLQAQTPPENTITSSSRQHLSFVDPFASVLQFEDRKVSISRQKVHRRSDSPPSPPSPTTTSTNLLHHHHQLQTRDRTRPWPLWPNAIPSRKRELMNAHADRYGLDPYFRAWMRANINSRTTSTSYTKYMIERENNPFINKRLDYVTPPSRTATLLGRLTGRYQKWRDQYPSIANRDNYEHNRRLECRKTVEHGSRLRIARFAFRNPVYPPHTPEMEHLGLTNQGYSTILADIEAIRRDSRVECGTRFLASLRRRRSVEDALRRVSEYIRKVNAQQRRVVWTIEMIPGVYERGSGGSGKEWEISAWNGEDALELLIQLETWGILEKRLSIEDEE